MKKKYWVMILLSCLLTGCDNAADSSVADATMATESVQEGNTEGMAEDESKRRIS